jgi:hypothetical protein
LRMNRVYCWIARLVRRQSLSAWRCPELHVQGGRRNQTKYKKTSFHPPFSLLQFLQKLL